jgi:hypothetical protein
MTVKKPVLIEFYMEHTCPVCRGLYYGLLERLEIERVIKVDKIDIHSSRGSEQWRKWKRFCERLGYDAVPLIMMGPYVFMSWKTRDKPETITEGVLSSLEYFEKQLKEKIKELDKYKNINYATSYEREALLSIQPELAPKNEGQFFKPGW